MNKKIKEIRLYATFTCPYCRMEKEWLASKNINHKTIMVDINPFEAQKVVNKTGQMGVPVTEITYDNNESEFVVGFDQGKLSSLFGLS